MVITYHGENYFKIQAGNFTLLLDPSNERSFRGASLILYTLKQPKILEFGEGPLVIHHQGEYEMQGVRIEGWNIDESHVFYKLKLDEVVLGILGHLPKELDPKFIEELDGPEILIIPAGGGPYISEEAAAKLIRQIKPSLVIPALYKNIKPFLKELGQDNCENEEKLVIKKKDLKPGAMTIKCLKS